jgi:hypothetical protein
MKPMEVIINELSKHTQKVTELQARLQQIRVSQEQVERDRSNAEKELTFEAGVISSLEFTINILQQDEQSKPKEESTN